MSKNKILSIAISLLVIPQITFAVWWNPISWFSFNKTKQTKEIVGKSAEQSGLNSVITKATSSNFLVGSTSKESQKKILEEVKNKELEYKKILADRKNAKEQIEKNTEISKKENTISPAQNETTKSNGVNLTIVTNQGGSIFYPENTIFCHNLETCKKTFSGNKKINLKAIPMEGYAFKEWSEASCGKSLECIINTLEDMTVYARFEVKKPIERTGRITSISHPSETCYVTLGRENCNIPLRWVNNTALDMLINLDGTEYYISTEDKNSFPYPLDADPVEIAKAETENATGLTFLTLERGTHKISLTGGGKTLDTVNINVECATDTSWDGRKCWQKGANQLFIFREEGVVIKSDLPGINCGYNPEKCLAGFASGKIVTLKAIVAKGRSFGEWTGDCSGKELTCTLLMDKQKNVGVKIR
ncbi:TPA: hypothetical protein DEP94_02375 [Candidatus Nomurabacteria bacterium]|nr:hypothetical protein [Candidatus Nomurabacteria bacterium]